jgi:hypothetical protein
MKQRLGAAVLFNRLTGAFEPASIFQGLDEANFRDLETLWKPALEKRAADFTTWADAADGNVQDAHWDWVGKAKSEATYESFAVECNGVTQALMLVDLSTRFARISSQKGLDLSYVELIASAPWNRPNFNERPKYKGAGRILIATAISMSVDFEFKGRIGLHSLPESETWYGLLGFTSCGFDEEKKMHYFEMTDGQAASFLRTEKE